MTKTMTRGQREVADMLNTLMRYPPAGAISMLAVLTRELVRQLEGKPRVPSQPRSATSCVATGPS